MTALRRPPLAALLLALLGVAILCGLGTWQLQRLQWKNEILAKLETAYAEQDAQPLDTENFGPRDFRYGRVSGIFRTDKALLLGPRTRNGKIGNDLLVPFDLGNTTIIVNMGWADGTLASQPIHHLNGRQVWFEGLARAPDWNAFTPENDPARNVWYRADTQAIANAKNLGSTLPFILYAERASHKFDAAFPNNERWQPNNNHAQYAMFWFSMAGILIVVFALRFIFIKH